LQEQEEAERRQIEYELKKREEQRLKMEEEANRKTVEG